MALTNITVFGTYHAMNGQPAKGSITFTPSSYFSDDDGIMIPPIPVKVKLNGSGSFSVQLPVVDEPGTNPLNVTYKVTENLSGRGLKRSRSYHVQLQSELLPEVNIADLVPVGSDVGDVQVLTPTALTTALDSQVPGIVAAEVETAVGATVPGLVDTSMKTEKVLKAGRYIVPITDFINEGETLNSDGSGVGNNVAIVQRAVDALNVLYAADGKPRQIYFPDGTYKFANQGTHGTAPYCIRWRSGVGMSTSSRRGVIFMPPATGGCVFLADVEWGNITDVYVDSHVVDGSPVVLAFYNYSHKAWCIQGMTSFSFTDICIKNTWSTGWGCDGLRRGFVSGEAIGCGRGIKTLGIDPDTTSGGSGFGIGTGWFEVEDVRYELRTRDNARAGLFIETQPGKAFKLVKGITAKVVSQGDWVAVYDAGADGLSADIYSVGATRCALLVDDTVLDFNGGGRNGNVKVQAFDGLSGVVLQRMTGAYNIRGDIYNNTSHGVHVNAASETADGLNLSGLNSYNNAGAGFYFENGLPKMVLDNVTTRGNALGGVVFAGTSKVSPDLTVRNSTFYDGVKAESTHRMPRVVLRNNRVSFPNTTNGLLVADVAATSVQLAVNAPPNAEGFTDIVWEHRTTAGPGSWTPFSHTASTNTTITITGLSATTQYDFRAAAVIGGQTQEYSNIVTATTGGQTVADSLKGGPIAGVSMVGRYAAHSSVALPWARAAGASAPADAVFRVTPLAAKVVCTTNTSSNVYSVLTPATAPTAVEYKNLFFASGGRSALVFRFGDDQNQWTIRSNGAGTPWALIKLVANSPTTVATGPNAATGDVVRVTIAGNVITGYINGVQFGQTTDSALAANLKCGIKGNPADQQTAFIDFKVEL